MALFYTTYILAQNVHKVKSNKPIYGSGQMSYPVQLCGPLSVYTFTILTAFRPYWNIHLKCALKTRPNRLENMSGAYILYSQVNAYIAWKYLHDEYRTFQTGQEKAPHVFR